jgi:FtsZ-interacting cell division protein YlmF
MGEQIKNFFNEFLGFGGDVGVSGGGGTDEFVDSPKVTRLRTVARTVEHEMLVVEPLSFEEAPALIAEIKNHRSLLINLHQMPADQHQRLVDLLTGAIVALNGQSQRISKDIFTFVPSCVNLAAAPRGQQTWNQGPQPGMGQQVPQHYVHNAI